MLDVLDRIEKVSRSDVNIFISGETGTGKEVVASAIHYQSPRRDAQFVAFNCAGVQDTLLESELFGHEKGAFTGATEQKKGLFEIADGGTIFLDEIGDLSPNNQTKIIRFLQDKINRRVGGRKEIPVNVRIISATNKNLEEAIKKGDFRQDLYQRLRNFDIHIPPLRDRREDIPLIIEHLIKKFRKELDSHMQIELNNDEIESLKNYRWPSNVRELENVVRRWFLLEEVDLDFFVDENESIPEANISKKGLEDAKKEFEKIYILKVLKQSNGIITLAAKKLNISPKKMYRKLEQHNLNAYLDKIRNSQK
jgi:DNA-binding NtrC family response regulator